jgi:ABC-type transport system involved in multi-copper enzyme maturation permease subunit
VGSVYALTLRQLSGRWRLLIMATLAALPVIMSVFALRQADAPSVAVFEAVVLSSMLAGSILPLVVLAIGGAAFSNEVEDRTIANLTLAPIPRWQIALPKLLAIITIASPFIAVSAFLTGHIAFLGDARATIAIVVSSLVAVAMYASVFVWLGLVSTQAIGIGLLYIVLWEGLFARFVAGVRLLSVRYFSIDVMHGLDERRFAAGNHLSLTAVLIVAALIIGGFLFLSVRRLRRMDIP